MKKTFLLVLLILISLPFVSAYWGGYLSPSDLLDNEWVVFAIIFVVFFAVSYFALGKSMKENKGAAVAISVAIAIFIAVAVSQRTRFYGYVGESIGGWLLIVALLLGAIILIKVITGVIGGIGLFIALAAVSIILGSIDPYDILPYSLLKSNFLPIYEFLAGSGFLILLIIIFVIVLIFSFKNKHIKAWLWASKEKKSALERLASTT